MGFRLCAKVTAKQIVNWGEDEWMIGEISAI